MFMHPAGCIKVHVPMQHKQVWCRRPPDDPTSTCQIMAYHVKLPGHVGGSQDKDLGVLWLRFNSSAGPAPGQAVHLYQQLSLHPPAGLMLSLCPPGPHEGVNLIQENCGGGMVSGKVKQHLGAGEGRHTVDTAETLFEMQAASMQAVSYAPAALCYDCCCCCLVCCCII